MNDKKTRTVAVIVVVSLIVLAWNLGNKQAMNSILVSSISSTTPTLIDGIVPAENDRGSSTIVEKGKNLREKLVSLVTGGESGESVQVDDQPAGGEVQVKSVTLSETGWVGVRDADGRVLGAGRFDAGTFNDVSVPLLRATVAGDSYQALLYADDGDRQFDLHKDTLITGANGGVAGANFKAL